LFKDDSDEDDEDDNEEWSLDDKPVEILDYLFLGSEWASRNKDALTTHGISHILTVADGLLPKFPEVPVPALSSLNNRDI
jgi:hypothetical protein